MQDEICRNVAAMQNILVKTDCSYPELVLDDKHVAAVIGKNYHQHYKRIQRYHEIFDKTGDLKLTIVEIMNRITSLPADRQ